MATKYNYSDLGELGKYLQDRETERNTYNAKKQAIAQNKAKQSSETTRAVKIDTSGLGSDLAEYLNNLTSTTSAKDYKAQLKAQREAIRQKWEQNRIDEQNRINEQITAKNKTAFDAKSNVKNRLDLTSLTPTERASTIANNNFKKPQEPRVTKLAGKDEKEEAEIRKNKQASISDAKRNNPVIDYASGSAADWFDYIGDSGLASGAGALEDIRNGVNANIVGFANTVANIYKAINNDDKEAQKTIREDIKQIGENLKSLPSSYKNAYKAYMDKEKAYQEKYGGSGLPSKEELSDVAELVKSAWSVISPVKAVASVASSLQSTPYQEGYSEYMREYAAAPSSYENAYSKYMDKEKAYQEKYGGSGFPSKEELSDAAELTKSAWDITNPVKVTADVVSRLQGSSRQENSSEHANNYTPVNVGEEYQKKVELEHPVQAAKGQYSPTQIIKGVYSNAIAMAPQIALGMATGSAFGNNVGRLTSGTALGMQSMAGAYTDAKKDGATDEQAVQYAVLEGVNQGMGDMLIGGANGTVIGWFDKSLSNLASHLVKTPLAKTALETAFDIAGEAGEEFTQNYVSTVNKRVTYDDDAEFDVNGAVYEGVLGGLGAILYAPGKAFSRYRINKASYNTVNDLSKAAASITSNEDLQTVTQIADKIIESADTVIADKETETADKANAEYIKRGAEAVKEQLNNTSEQVIKRNSNVNKWVDDYLSGNKETTAKNLTDLVWDINSTSFGNNSSNKINNAVDYINDAIQQQKEVISQANNYVGISDATLNQYMGSQTITDLAKQNARQMIAEANEKISKLKKLSETIRSQKQDIEKGLKYGSAVFDKTEVANEPPINRTTSQTNTSQQTDTVNTQTVETQNKTDVKAETPLTETESNATINTEETANKTEAATPTVETPVAETTAETQVEEKKPSLTHFTTKHTKTGENLEVFTINGHLDTDEYNVLKTKIKEVGGTYSKFLKGFIVPSDKVDNAVSKVSEFADVTEKNATDSSASDTSGENTATTAATDNAATVVPKAEQDNAATADTTKQAETQTTSKANASASNTGLDSTLAEFDNNSVVDAKPGNTAVIEYANDGNTVVKHYKHLNSISGNLYYSDINEFGDTSLYLYFPEVNTALEVGNVNSKKTVRELMKRDDINISLSEFADRLITVAKNGGFVRDSNIAVIEKAYPEKAEELRIAKAEWRKKREAEEAAKQEKKAKEFEEKAKETNKQTEAKLEEAANKLISQNATVKNETVTTYDENHNERNTKLLLALLRKYDVKAPLATQGFINNKVEDIVIKNGKIDTMHLSSKGHSDSAYAVLDKLISAIKDAKADTKTDADAAESTSNAANTTTIKENKNNDESTVERENRPDVRGLRPDVAETVEEKQGVQSETEQHGGERSGAGERLPRVADGTRDSGESIRNSQPDKAGDSDTRADERNDSKGNDGGRNQSDDEHSGRQAESGDGRLGNDNELLGVSGEVLEVNEEQTDEKKKTVKKKSDNFSYSPEEREYINKKRPNIQDNIAAIKTLQLVEREGRKATAEEKDILAKYKGWGGLSNAFSSYSTNQELKNLLNEEEYNEARRSTQNAHYTSLDVIEAMYEGLTRMGFNGGNLLEPSMGVGNFFGMLPKAVANKTNLYGVEMDSITGRIAKALYGDADITIAPYQDAMYVDNSFDAAIGNVPFSSTTYNYKGEKHMLHDYFFVKTLDKIKDGGAVMFVTSTGTLDKANPKTRDAIAKKADLIAAFRLPGNAFKANAGTEVTTDIIVLRKRPDGVPQSTETFFAVSDIDGIPINEYFVRHPENILGKLVLKKDMYASERTQVEADERDYDSALTNAMNSLPKNILQTDMVASQVVVEDQSGKSRFMETDGKLYFYDGNEKTKTELKSTDAERARQYMRLKDAYNGALNVSNNPNATDAERKAASEHLNKTYDDFVAKYKHLSSGTTKTALRNDSDYWMMTALEKKVEGSKNYEKADIFKNDLRASRPVEHVGNAHDALAVSLSNKGKVDVNYIQKLTGQSEEEITDALADSIIKAPDGDYELIALYASGNVREKLEKAERAAKTDPAFEKNVELLRASMPHQYTADEIVPKFGANWIDVSHYRNFIKDTFGVTVTLGYDKDKGEWIAEYVPKYAYNPKYGNADTLSRILIPTLMQKQVTIKNSDGTVDTKTTGQMRQYQQMLRDDFSAWIFGAEERRKVLEEKFNGLYASWKGADFKEVGKHLTLEGKNPEINLRDYQMGAIARVAFGGNTLLAHGVGTGKTFEMIASAMECKKLGITHKNLFVVPANKISDFKSDILKLYPNAKVMASKKGADAEERSAFISSLATTDFDIAVIGHPQFKFIPVSNETKRNSLNAQLAEIDATLANMSQDEKRNNRRTVKQIEKSKESLEKKLKELETAKDATVNFESIGVDGLFVDEAHNFKKLPYYTKLKIAGVASGDESQRAYDMYEKTQYVQSIHGRVVFGTATPITNAVAEVYNMTRFVAPEVLTEAGIDSFDAWAGNFGNIENGIEIKPDGVNFRVKERFSKFVNVNAMTGMFRRFTDIIRSDEVLKDLPKAERVDVVSESNEQLEKYLSDIQTRIENLSAGGFNKDNMLLITADGRGAALDLRLVAKQLKMSPNELDLSGSKVNRTVENVVREYKNSASTKGTQLVFLDIGLSDDPTARLSFDIAADLVKKLTAQGIPANEIARIDKVSDAKLEDFYKQVNDGKVRVVIGSTAKMGEGLNVQTRLVALHHMNPPYRPSDIEQREGRIIRYGNENKNVRIYRYLQKRSFDSYMWQMLERKQTMINQAMSSGDVAEIEDVDDFVLSAAEGKAITSGNPLLLKKMELDNKFKQLSTAKSVFMRSVYSAQDVIANNPRKIETDKRIIDGGRKNANIINSHPFNGDFEITLQGKVITKRKTANEEMQKILNDGRYGMNKVHEIGSIRGMKLSFEQSGGRTMLYLDGALRLYVEAGADNVARLVNALESASKFETSDELKRYQDEVSGYEKQLADAKKIVNSSFPKQKEYDETVAELNSVNEQMKNAAGGIDDELVYDADANDDSANEDSEAKQNVFQSKSESRWSVGANSDNSDKIKSVTELKNDAERLFGVPINKGKLGVKAAGVYKTHAGTIRTRVDGDLPTIAHELGHRFDNKYGLSSLESAEGLVDHYRNEIEELGYDEEVVTAEAIAHYFADLMKDREATEAEFPDFTDDLFDSLKGSDVKYLPQYIVEMNKYFAADRLRRREADVHYRTEEKSFTGQAQFQVDSFLANPRAYFGNVARTAVKYLLNDISTFKKFGRAHDYAMKERAANSVAYGRLTQAFTDNDGNVIGKSLKAILFDGNINTINRTAFDAYLQTRIALDRINAAENSGDPSFKTQVYADADLQNKDNIVADIERYERENPTFHDCAQELYEYENNLLKIAEDAGLLDSELVSYLKDTFPHYVPLYRVMDDSNSASAKSGRGAKTPSSVVGRFKGSGRGKWSPIENIMNQTASFTKAILQNQTREAVFSEIDDNKDMGIWAEKVPMAMVRDTVSTAEVKDIIKDFDFEHFTDIKSTDEKLDLIDAINRAIGGTTGMWKKADNQGKNVVSVMRDGKAQYYEIHDKNLMDALLSLSPQSSSILSKVFRKATNAFANLTTGSNPRFGYNNLIRDMQTGFVNSQTTDNPFKFTVDLIKAFNDIVRDTDDYKRFRANGGGYSGAFTMNIGNLQKLSNEIVKESNKGKRLIQETFRFVPRALDGVETANRFAEYQRNIKAGSDALTALRASQNITVNFQQGGKLAKEVNAFIPYFNASIQSVYQMCEHIVDKKTRKRTLAKIFATSIANAALAIGLRELIKRLLPDDDKADEAYENLSAYNKFANWNIYIGDGEFVRIPKEKNLMIFSTLLEATFEKVVNDDQEAYDGIAQYFAESVMPPFINDVTLFGTLMELRANETYTGAPIIPSAYQDLAPELQYNGDTSSVSIALGSALGVSPMVIDYIIDDNTGFIGDLYINLTKSEGTSLSEMLDTVKTSEKSLLRGMSVPSVLLRDATYSTDIVSNFYDTKEEYTQNSKSYKATNGQNSKYTFYDTYGKYKYDKIASLYSDVNNLIKADNDSDTSRETRWMLNSIIKSVNETESTQLDKDVAELSERTGYSFQEIAPFIVVPESLNDSEKNEYYLDAYDLMNYYTESQLLFEYWYPQVISSGYDDESMAEALKQMKKEIKSEMDARYLEILSH